MINDADSYFRDGCGRCERFASDACAARIWHSGQHTLRRLCLDLGLQETVKWGHPCYMHKDRNIALISAFRGDFRLTLFNAALLDDPQQILEKQGPNSQHAEVLRFSDESRVAELQTTIRQYLQQLMHCADQGIRPEKKHRQHDIPDELKDALLADPELDQAFQQLTPGRQRSYLLNLNAAKQSQTRIRRIEKFRPHILAGKGANER